MYVNTVSFTSLTPFNRALPNIQSLPASGQVGIGAPLNFLHHFLWTVQSQLPLSHGFRKKRTSAVPLVQP